MNAESEMAGADGLGREPDCNCGLTAQRCPAHPDNVEIPADPLDALAQEVGYSEDTDDPDQGSVEALIGYKNALEDRCRHLEAESDRAEAALTQCQHIAYDGTVPYTEDQIKADKHLWMLDKVREIAEGGKADPEFVAMLAAADAEDEPTAEQEEEISEDEEDRRVRPDGPETERGGLIGQQPY